MTDLTPNKTLVFKKIPQGLPTKGEDLVVEDRPLDLSSPPSGGLIYKVNYVSFDPYLRGRMRDPSIKSYLPAFTLGEPVTNRGIATVVKSDSDKFKPGDVVVTWATAVAEYGVTTAELLSHTTLLNPRKGMNPRYYLGPLGLAGWTGYGSLHEIGKPKKGEVIFISSAAGAVGQVVGQVAKKEGLRVIGSAGSDEKVDYIVKHLGFDAGFNYKTETAAEALKRLAPDGIDIYFDNVGGEQLEAAIDASRDHARIIACGMISEYNLKPTPENPKPGYPIRNLFLVVTRRLTFRGFITMDSNIAAWIDRCVDDIGDWIEDGSFKFESNVVHGIDSAIDGFLAMYTGGGRVAGHTSLELDPLPGWEGK